MKLRRPFPGLSFSLSLSSLSFSFSFSAKHTHTTTHTHTHTHHTQVFTKSKPVCQTSNARHSVTFRCCVSECEMHTCQHRKHSMNADGHTSSFTMQGYVYSASKCSCIIILWCSRDICHYKTEIACVSVACLSFDTDSHSEFVSKSDEVLLRCCKCTVAVWDLKKTVIQN